MFTRKKAVWLFLLPALAGLAVFYVAPFFGGIYFSLTDGTYQNAFVGMQNYLSVWKNEMFRLGLKNTLILSALCAPLTWILSFLLAALLDRWNRHNAFVRNALLMPYLMPSSAILLIWLIAFDYGGPINHLIAALGGPRVLWLEGAGLRVPVVLMYLWKNLGFCVVIFTAALQAVPVSLYEYASLEGAGFFRREFHITLPLIAPSAYLVFVLCWINAFKIFKEVYFIGGAYPDDAVYTLQNYMNNMFGKLNYQNVTTAAYSFAVLVIAFFGVLYFLQSHSGEELS